MQVGDVVEYWREDNAYPEEQGMWGIVRAVSDNKESPSVRVDWLWAPLSGEWSHLNFHYAPPSNAVVRPVGIHIDTEAGDGTERAV